MFSTQDEPHQNWRFILSTWRKQEEAETRAASRLRSRRKPIHMPSGIIIGAPRFRVTHYIMLALNRLRRQTKGSR